jgi:hypothetical protein
MEEQTLQWTRESGKQIYIKWKNRHYNGQGNLGNRFILNGRTDITMDKGIWETDLYRRCLLSNQLVYYLNTKIFGNNGQQK